jgi:hypothetical protein
VTAMEITDKLAAVDEYLGRAQLEKDALAAQLNDGVRRQERALEEAWTIVHKSRSEELQQRTAFDDNHRVATVTLKQEGFAEAQRRQAEDAERAKAADEVRAQYAAQRATWDEQRRRAHDTLHATAEAEEGRRKDFDEQFASMQTELQLRHARLRDLTKG